MNNEKEQTKEEKLEKAKQLLAELNELELSDEELQQISGGTYVNQQITDAITQA